MMTQDGLEEMEPKREGGGEGEEHQEDDEAPEDLYLVDGGRAQVEQDAPQVDEKHRLPLVVSSLDEAVVDMAFVRLSDAHSRARMRRMMAEKVSMMGTPATMSGMMSEVSAAVRDTLSSEMEPSANPSSSEPESPRSGFQRGGNCSEGRRCTSR